MILSGGFRRCFGVLGTVILVGFTGCAGVPREPEPEEIRSQVPQTDAEIRVRANHDGDVFANGTFQGTLDDEGELLIRLAPGSHVISIVPRNGPEAGSELFRRVDAEAGRVNVVEFQFESPAERGDPEELSAPAVRESPSRPSGTMVIDLPRGRYDGDVLNGVPHGFGRLTTGEGDEYEGGWRTGRRHGHGEMRWTDGGRYVGSWRDGEMDGRGELVTGGGERYEGEFRQGDFHGSGVLRSADGRYEGEWEDGKKSGVGVMAWADGDYYEGEWSEGKPHGFGFVIWNDDITYEGEFARGQPHGFGTYREPDDLVYEGEFEHGRATGGVLTTPSGDRYWATMTPTGAWDWTRSVDE